MESKRKSSRKSSIPWSGDEVKLLEQLYPKIWVKDLVHKFPIRSKATIVAKALQLGLASAKLWQPKENKLLFKYFENSPKEQLINFFPGRSWTAIMAQAERLDIKRKRDKPRLAVNEAYFKKWSFNMAYLLGFILADGCIIQGIYKGYSDSLKFGVQLRDVDIIKKIKKELSSDHKISVVKNAAHFCIASRSLVDDLKSHNISYRKSLREKLPLVPHKYVRDFIRGIIDGDGSLSLDKKNYPTISVSGGRAPLEYIRNHIFQRFELYSVLSRITYSKDAKRFLYQISYRANSAKTIIDYLYKNATLYLNRKYDIAMKCSKCDIKLKNNSAYRLKRYNETHSG